MTSYFFAFLCVLGLAVGQLLFKATAIAMSQAGTIMAGSVLLPLTGALALYGITSLGWVWILQRIELGRVYPVMAAAFVLVPLGSHYFFAEKFSLQYVAGATLIAAGIILIARA
jgi:drug/metabolite transporter (DMT)-like permease